MSWKIQYVIDDVARRVISGIILINDDVIFLYGV